MGENICYAYGDVAYNLFNEFVNNFGKFKDVKFGEGDRISHVW